MDKLERCNVGPEHPEYVHYDGLKFTNPLHTQVIVYQNGVKIAHFIGLMAKVNAMKFVAQIEIK